MSTPVCAMPGCVGEAVKGKWCAIHGTAGPGKRCEKCKGTGKCFYKGGSLGDGGMGICDVCGGVGVRDAKKSMRIPEAEVVPIDERGLIKAQE